MKVLQEDDRLPAKATLRVFGAVVLSIVISLALSALFLLLATGRLRPSLGAARGVTSPAPREIAGVEQTPIATDLAGLRLVEAQRELLRRYAWVDKREGVVRLPIERAMELVLSEQAP